MIDSIFSYLTMLSQLHSLCSVKR